MDNVNAGFILPATLQRTGFLDTFEVEIFISDEQVSRTLNGDLGKVVLVHTFDMVILRDARNPHTRPRILGVVRSLQNSFSVLLLAAQALGKYKIVRLNDLEHLPSFVSSNNSWFAYNWYSVRKDVDQGSH